MTETLKSTNGRRVAIITRITGGYAIELNEVRRFGSSTRTRKAPRKPEAVEIARKWVRR